MKSRGYMSNKKMIPEKKFLCVTWQFFYFTTFQKIEQITELPNHENQHVRLPFKQEFDNGKGSKKNQEL